MTTPERDYNREYQDTSERAYAYDFDSVLRRYMIRQFRPLLPKGKALELGCYKGEFTEILTKHYDDLTVIEASDELIAEARQRVPASVRFVHSTFENASLPAAYDAIFLIHTLEHLDDAPGVLRRVDSWLAPGGRLFLVCPNANAPSRQIAVKMGLISHNAAVTEGERVHGHRITYSLDTLERDARAGGLTVLQRSGVFFKPFANFQFDKLMKTDIVSTAYLDGCYELGMLYPDLSASIFLLCGKSTDG
jgi:2-polyprenyl-3-methyl-5-hydroxy-6-metoxy-1,4-benzoquinol methylase